MKILVFTWRDLFHPQAGGAEVNIHTHAENWIQSGHKVTFFTARYKGSKAYENLKGIEIYRAGNKLTVYILACFYYLFIFRKQKFDFIVDIENGIPFFTPIYSKVPSLLFIHHIHFDQFFTLFSFPMNYIGYFLEKYLMPLVYKNKQIVTVSQSSREDILKYKLTNKDVEVIYNGVDLDFYHPNSDKTKYPSLIYLGRTVAQKRIDSIIKAFHKVIKSYPDAILTIAGKGAALDSLIELVNSLKLKKSVIFKGFVEETQDGKVRLFSEAWAFVAFSLWEGWGLTSTEAQACGTLSIVADVKGLRETIVDSKTGYLIEDGNVDVLAESMMKVFSDKKKAIELGGNAREHVKKFSWEENSSRFIELIKKIRNEQ
ncbi:MAG: glycosyltransferase family 4 protein [Candidatus Dojkabacteria bacterium]